MRVYVAQPLGIQPVTFDQQHDFFIPGGKNLRHELERVQRNCTLLEANHGKLANDKRVRKQEILMDQAA